MPVITTDLDDEGTIFAFNNTLTFLTYSSVLLQYLETYFPDVNAKAVTAVLNSYPDNPDDGSPFGTNTYNYYPEYKRLAAFLGDLGFTLRRRKYLQTISSKVPTWSGLGAWYSNTLTEFPYLGTFHAADMLVLWKGIQPRGVSDIQQGLFQYYISFVNSMDPNSLAQPHPVLWPSWPQYTVSSGGANSQLISIAPNGTIYIMDRFRPDNYAALVTYDSKLAI